MSTVDISWEDSSSDGGTALRRSLQAIYGALSLHRVAIRAHIPSCHNILLYSFDLGQVVLENIHMDSRFTTCDKQQHIHTLVQYENKLKSNTYNAWNKTY